MLSQIFQTGILQFKYFHISIRRFKLKQIMINKYASKFKTSYSIRQSSYYWNSMDKIQESNKLLDALQRKMQNHFTKHHGSQNQNVNERNGIDSYYLTEHHNQSKERMTIPSNEHIQHRNNSNRNSHKDHLNYQSKVNQRNPFMRYALDSVNDQQEHQIDSRQKSLAYGQMNSNFKAQRYNLNQETDRYFVPPDFNTNNKSDPHLLTSNYTEQNQISGKKIRNLIQKHDSKYRGQQYSDEKQKANLNFIPETRNNRLGQQREIKIGHNNQMQRLHSANNHQKDMKQQTFKIFNKKKHQDKTRQQSMDAQITQNTPNKPYGGSNINLVQKKIDGKEYQFVNPRVYNADQNHNSINLTHSMSQSHHLKGFETIKTIENLLQEKIKIKEATVKQLESELRLQNQQKVHLYKINIRLQQQFRSLSQQIKQKQDDQTKGLTFLVQRLKRLKAESLLQKRSLLKQQKILAEQQKQLLRGRKEFLKYDKQTLQKQLNIEKKSKSKSCLQNGNISRKYTGISGCSHSQIPEDSNKRKNNQLLIELVGQLERLKNVVERKVKQTRNFKPHIK